MRIHYIHSHIKLYIGITRSIFLALPSNLLFILLLQSENGARSLKITFLLTLFATAFAAVVLATDIEPLTSLYASI